jgi:NAD(P)-dependent dehydrogenase (short-subunit alcohol dehydrogenase family)
MDLGLVDKVALISGSYRGIGRGIAEALAREGARVAVHGFEPGQAERACEELQELGLSGIPVMGDLLTDDGVDQLTESLTTQLGGVDVLINNYGEPSRGSWLDKDTDSERWLDMYQRNVLSGVRLVRALAPRMQERNWGRIIFVGTVGSTRPNARPPHYYAAKAALTNMAVSLSQELSGTGITVNTVSPGLIATQEVRERFTRLAEKNGRGTSWPEVERYILDELMPSPSSFVGEVSDVANLIAFLASDRARYLNGANFRIDGGSTAAVN